MLYHCAGAEDDEQLDPVSARYQEACNKIASEAIRNGSSDNVTVMLVSITKQWTRSTSSELSIHPSIRGRGGGGGGGGGAVPSPIRPPATRQPGKQVPVFLVNLRRSSRRVSDQNTALALTSCHASMTQWRYVMLPSNLGDENHGLNQVLPSGTHRWYLFSWLPPPREAVEL